MKALAGVVVLTGLIIGGVSAGAAPGRPAAASAAATPTLMVVGTGHVDMREHTGADVQYSVRINAFEDPVDGFQGSVNSRITRADSGTVIVFSRVTCVVISGNSVWISSVVTLSTNESVYAAGDVLITYVRDFGDSGDVLHQDAAKNLLAATFDFDGDGDVDCHDRPALYPSTVTSGDIVIK
jgi:hypothetical protein